MSLSPFAAAARPAALAMAVALAACAGDTVRDPWRAVEVPADTVRMVASIRAAAGDGEGELAVEPLRDARVEDLRQQAARLEAAGEHQAAAETLDRAMEIVEGDPALLQERAELAVLLGDFATADVLAQRAYALGSQVGPLCRRHWATLEQLRLLADDAEGAASARQQIAGCRVAGPDRF